MSKKTATGADLTISDPKLVCDICSTATKRVQIRTIKKNQVILCEKCAAKVLK